MGFVNVKIKDIWEADKNMKSLYVAIEEYCKLRGKDFNKIAVHFAEYESLYDLYRKIDLSLRHEGTIINQQTEAMYNLFVSGDENAWEGASFVLELDRCITWTEQDIQSKYTPLTDDSINELKQFPCLFAYETPCQKAPKFGFVTHITKGGKNVGIECEFRNLDPALSLDNFEELKIRLGIFDKREFNRTHWAVKNVDLIEALQSKGYTIHTEREVGLNPVVFISYSWDNEDHKEWVLALANKLCADGVDVKLDRYEAGLGTNLPYFMEDAIRLSNRVIIVFTPNYKNKADSRTGGVGYEYSIINNQVFNNILKNKRIIPVLRAGNINDSIPSFMQQYLHLNMGNDFDFENQYQELLRNIYLEPVVKKPRIGKKPKFS